MNTSKIIKGVVSNGRYTVTMLTKEGFELKHEVFLHEAPAPEPEEVEDTTE